MPHFIRFKRKKQLTKILHKKTNFKKVGFSTMAFTAKILSWRFRHLNIVGCLLKRRPTKGGSRAPQDPPQLHPCTRFKYQVYQAQRTFYVNYASNLTEHVYQERRKPIASIIVRGFCRNCIFLSIENWKPHFVRFKRKKE